jgi:hypothetical protein
MLLRGSQASAGFTVPVVKRRLVESADPLRDKLERIGTEALLKRDAIDARVSALRASSRSRRALLDRLREAQERGETGKGFAKRFEGEMRKVRAERMAGAGNDRALELLKQRSDDLDGWFFDRALKVEAGTRARERVASIGKAIDVAATRADPARFEAHHAEARKTLDGVSLPAKVAKAFRARLPEIPRAALLALAEHEPTLALEFVERRKGPAHPKFGLTRTVVRLIGKQALAKLDADQSGSDIERQADASRVLADRTAAVEAVGRGEETENELSLVGLSAIGGRHARQLRGDIRDARKVVSKREKFARAVRERLSAGSKLDPKSDADAEGLDIVYARDVTGGANDDAQRQRDVSFAAAAGMLPRTLAKAIGNLVLGDDTARVIEGVKLIQALERVDGALTETLDRHVLQEAHEILDIVESGVDWHEAVRMSRDNDVSAPERDRRAPEFVKHLDIERVFDVLGEALGLDAGERSARP